MGLADDKEDFINAANNSSSGLWVLLMNTPLRAGTGCTINGFVGQLSIQVRACQKRGYN